MAKVVMNINYSRLRRVVRESPDMDNYMRLTAHRVNDTAAGVFRSRERRGNEHRTSETSPPNYLRSFGVRRHDLGNRYVYYAYNTDPAAVWIELGAHAGGRTAVLRYRPYGRALDILGGGG